MLVTIAITAVTTAQLAVAELSVQLETDAAMVTAEYVFAEDVTDVVLHAIQLPRQTVAIVNSSIALQPSPHAGLSTWRGTLTNFRFVVEYRVTPLGERVPLIVPTEPSMPGVTSITIDIHGLEEDQSLVDGFPRMVRQANGGVVAMPANLPSFLLLPRDRTVPRARVADAIVLGLLLAASVFWYVRRGPRIA